MEESMFLHALEATYKYRVDVRKAVCKFGTKVLKAGGKVLTLVEESPPSREDHDTFTIWIYYTATEEVKPDLD